MSPMTSPVVALFVSFLLLLSAADAFNINKILSAYPDFTTFNNLLTQTGVASEINKQQSITVLVVDNAHISALSSQSTDAVKKILSVLVILEYYDEVKLKKLHSKKSLILTSLYQQSGKAQNQQGFLNMKPGGNDPVAFGSAAPGSNLDCTFVKQITAQPYHISQLQVSTIINVALTSTSPSYPPDASPPRKALTPGPSYEESPAQSPTNPSKAPAASAPASTSSDASIGYDDYLASTILMISLGFGFSY